MNQKFKNTLLVLLIFVTSLILLFLISGIFISFSSAKAGSVFCLFLSVPIGLLIIKCIKGIKGNSFKNKFAVRIISVSCIIVAFVSIFFLPDLKENNNSKLVDAASVENNIEIVSAQNDVSELENKSQQLNESVGNNVEVENNIDKDNNVSEDISNHEDEIGNVKINDMEDVDKNNSAPNERDVVEDPGIIDKSTQKEKIKVYVGSKGKKYHYKHCRTLKTSKTLTAYTIDEAKSRNYTPCGVCNPPLED